MALRLPLRLQRSLRSIAAAFLCLVAAAPAHAEGGGLFSDESLSAVADFRLVASNGEKAWTDEGFGKARFGGTSDGDWKVRPVATEAEVIWQPRFSWAVSGTVVAAWQDDQQHPVDLVEAFVSVKPLPSGGTHVSGRAGLYWPQVSLEHSGAAWQVTDMITPSAINSWIGEEVKVIGAEATLAQDIGSSQISATGGIFGFNDTAGTLLAFRGWALHDLKATAFGHQQLPPLNDFMVYAQAARTRPLIEIDDRPGFYGRAALKLAAPLPVTVSAFYYNNRGDPEAATKRLQWGWETRFWNFGARVDLSQKTRFITQVLTGTTEMGIETDEEYWASTRFRSAFARLSHQIGDVTLSGRAETFRTKERGYEMAWSESEKGWATTAAASWKLSRHVSLVGEAIHISSKRGTRARLGLNPRQKQTIVQAAIRLSI